jgi:hypothetical protein
MQTLRNQIAITGSLFRLLNFCTISFALPRLFIALVSALPLSPFLGIMFFDKFYTLWSLPQFLIFCHSGLSRIFLAIPNSRKDSRQAGMTLETNIQFLTPCGLCRKVLHNEKERVYRKWGSVPLITL